MTISPAHFPVAAAKIEFFGQNHAAKKYTQFSSFVTTLFAENF